MPAINKSSKRRQKPAPRTTRAKARPHLAIGPADAHAAEVDARARLGRTTSQLAEEFQHSEREVQRLLRAARVQRIWNEPIEYVASPEFERADADELILGPAPEAPGKKGRLRAPAGLPPYLASLYEVPLLTREQEVHHFRKFNYLKYKALTLRDGLDPERVTAKDLDRIEGLLHEASQVKNLLVRTNLRLVISISKRYARANANFFEVVSDGNVSLMRAIDKFDYTRGFKLSTYATWAIKRNFARTIPAEYTQMDRFRTGNEELFQNSLDGRSNQFADERTNRKQHEALMVILQRLQERERDILALRFGLAGEGEPMTLEQIGKRFGVSKERIRQVETRALSKLREIVQHESLDVPGI